MQFRVHFTFYLFILAIFFSRYQASLFIMLVCFIIHELGHIFMCLILGYKIDSFTLYPFGGELCIKDAGSSLLKDLFVYSGGILFNLCSMAIPNESMRGYSLIMVIINSVPIFPLDGYSLLSNLFYYIFPYKYVLRVGSSISLILTLGLFILSVKLKTMVITMSLAVILVKNIEMYLKMDEILLFERLKCKKRVKYKRRIELYKYFNAINGDYLIANDKIK